MALPVQTPEDRAAALEKAARSRKERAEVKNRLKTGQMTVEDVLDLALTNEVIAGMKVLAMLQSLHGIGKVRARETMVRLGIAENRKIGGLGKNQRTVLVEEFTPATV
jgi:hypothetical protein